MTIAPPPARILARPLAVVDAAKSDTLAATDFSQGDDRPDARPAVMPIEDQRERAQQEFKRIWTLCTLTR